MSLLTGDTSKLSAIEKIVGESLLTEIQSSLDEFEIRLEANGKLVDSEQKARIELASSLKSELNLLRTDIQHCMAMMEKEEAQEVVEEKQEGQSFLMLKAMFDEEKSEHENTKKFLLKIQAEMAKVLQIVTADKKKDAKDDTAKNVSIEVVQRDDMGRTRKIIMTKG